MRILYLSDMFTVHDQRFLSTLAQNTPYQIYFTAMNKNLIEDLPSGIKHKKLATHLNQTEDLKKLVEEIQPDLVHAGPIHTAGALAKDAGCKPLVTTSWGYDLLLEADRNLKATELAKAVLKQTSVLICDCITSKNKAVTLGFPEKNIVTMPWGVDLQHFTPHPSLIRQQLNWKNNFVILCSRTWEAIYGVDLVAKAFVQIAHQFPNARLLLVGAGSQKNVVENVLSAGKVSNKVYFAGRVKPDDLPNFYRAADIYVSASHVDGSSVSLLEAMACALPVIVSDIPSNKEWISAKQGWLFKDNNVADLVRALSEAYISKNLNNMGMENRIVVEKKANWHQNFPRLLDAYQLAIESHRVA